MSVPDNEHDETAWHRFEEGLRAGLRREQVEAEGGSVWHACLMSVFLLAVMALSLGILFLVCFFMYHLAKGLL